MFCTEFSDFDWMKLSNTIIYISYQLLSVLCTNINNWYPILLEEMPQLNVINMFDECYVIVFMLLFY